MKFEEIKELGVDSLVKFLIKEVGAEKAEELAQKFSDRIKKNNDVKRNYDDVKRKIAAAESEYQLKLSGLKSLMIEIQNECEHPSEYVEFYPDASGNSDSYEECTLCGLVKTRIIKKS